MKEERRFLEWKESAAWGHLSDLVAKRKEILFENGELDDEC